MAGIICTSTSRTMLAAETSADKSVSGYIKLEECGLSATPTGSSYVWGLSKPNASTSRCALSSSTDAAPTFTPDVEGYYVVTCTVDSTTTYVIRLAVADIAEVSTLSTIRMLPLANSQVPTPATGRTIYFSSDANGLVEKRPDGSVHVITVV